MPKPSKLFLYGIHWSPTSSPLWREMQMIAKGGRWVAKKTGKYVGKGLLFHYKAGLQLLWPEFKQHRWFDLMLENWIKHKYIGVMGPKNSGKTSGMAVIHLFDWYCFSSQTTVLLCSTTKEMLENRIWGEVKKWHRIGKERYPWLPGSLIEGRQRIVADSRDVATEGRDFRNGIMGIPLKKGGTYVGISDIIGIKNKRKRLCGDELQCVIGSTLIDTPVGLRTIDSLRVGDEVFSVAGIDRIKTIYSREVDQILRIKTFDGRELFITSNHPVLTQFGWKKACEVNEGHYILDAYEAMRILRQPIGESETFLQSVLHVEMGTRTAGDTAAEVSEHFARSKGETRNESRMGRIKSEVDAGMQSNEESQDPQACLAKAEGNRSASFGERREWNRSDEGRATANTNVSRRGLELRDQDRQVEWERIPSCLQGGLRFSRKEGGNRSGRSHTHELEQSEGKGRQEGRFFSKSWVESIEVLKQGDIGFPATSGDSGRCRVFNLEVERHPSYVANGLVVHNCLPKSFIDATANFMDQGECKVTGMGNPAQTTDALGIICEPAANLGGWDGGIDQTPKTKTWETRFSNGICIQLPGSDSPNSDAKEGEPIPFPFLMTRAQMDADAKTWGREDWHYTMFNEGRMPRGQGSRRVITRQLCVTHKAMEEAIWANTQRTIITSLDAAYRGVGGDRCVYTEVEFGEEARPIEEIGEHLISNLIDQSDHNKPRQQILSLMRQVVIPIEASDFKSPEDQIVQFVRNQHETRMIPPENHFFDAGMRTSLVSAYALLWSPKVNTIDFGGRPTERKVSANIDVSCRDYYSKYVTELWFSVRLIIEAGQFRGLTEDLIQEGCQREWITVAGNKIEVETKDDMKLKTGRSPDLFDSLVCAIEGCRQRGFIIKRLDNPRAVRTDWAWKRDLRDKANTLWRSKELNVAA